MGIAQQPPVEPPASGVTISRLIPVDIKNAWPTEPLAFTPWLLENADVLSDVLGVEVELTAREHPVGTFRLDLIGQVAGSEDRVIIENQYGETDHRHLGQIMTYAGGTEAKVIIWVAERFREEHRAALEWLNQNTVPDIRFFGVAVGAVRMQGGDPNILAPRLDLVVKPNDWEKLAKLEATSTSAGATGVSTVAALYKRFWERFSVEAKSRGWTNGTPPAANWWNMPTGTATISWGVSYAMFGCRSELYFQHPDPAVNAHRLGILEQRRDQLESVYGSELLLDPLPGKNATRVDVRREGPKITDEESWDDVILWFVDSQERLRAAVDAVGGVPTSTP